MQVLLAVVEDLYTFATSLLFGWRQQEQPRETLYLAAKTDVLKDTDPEPIVGNDGVQTDVPLTEDGLPQKNTIVYAAQALVPLTTVPEDAADTVIDTLAYGDMVMMLEAGEEWSYVAAGNKKGYVRTSNLAHRAAAVYPEFVVGAENGPRATNTVRVRSLIKDEFSANLSHIPLQAHEYVYYKLRRKGITIAWPDIRPRTPGTWVRILSTLPEVRLSAEPTVGSVMEVAPQDGKAHLAYVERVIDRDSIVVSEADWPERGIYNERTLTRTEWERNAPVFISFS